MKYYFTVFCVFLTIGLAFLTLSCRPPDNATPTPKAAELLIIEPNAFFQDGNDLILASYRDPALQDKVLNFFEAISGSSNIAAAILENASKFDIAPALAFSLCAEESAYNPQAFNRNKNETVDRGLFQLNSASFPYLKVVEFYDPALNAWYGIAHLRWCMDTAGTEVAALAMYNAGMTRVHSGGTPKQTLDYISRILQRQKKIESLFVIEYQNMIKPESVLAAEREPFRLSLLMPLGGR